MFGQVCVPSAVCAKEVKISACRLGHASAPGKWVDGLSDLREPSTHTFCPCRPGIIASQTMDEQVDWMQTISGWNADTPLPFIDDVSEDLGDHE